jgi:hypothetical protein
MIRDPGVFCTSQCYDMLVWRTSPQLLRGGSSWEPRRILQRNTGGPYRLGFLFGNDVDGFWPPGFLYDVEGYSLSFKKGFEILPFDA